MKLHTSYTDRYSVEEAYDRDWDDIMSPDDYEEYLERKQFAKSNGYNYRPYRTLNNYQFATLSLFLIAGASGMT